MRSYPLYKIELRNKNNELIKNLTNICKSLSWKYNQIGGCGLCNVTLATTINNVRDYIAPDYIVNIYVSLDGSLNMTLMYTGFIDQFRPSVKKSEGVTLTVQGFVAKLKRLNVQATYTDKTVREIMIDILDNYVTVNTDITYNSADIDVAEFVCDSIEFSTSADNAIDMLAELAEGYEYGVDRNKNFYFKKKSETATYSLVYGKDLQSFDEINDYSTIVNRIKIKGGGTFAETVDNTESQGYYGLREKVVSNSAITTSTVAQRYGNALLADDARIKRRCTAKGISKLVLYENTVPINQLLIVKEPVAQAKKYGEIDAIYGRFVYGGLISYIINNVSYSLEDEKISVDLTLGDVTPDIADQIKRIQYEIEQIRNS